MKLHIGSRARAEGWTTFDIEPGPGVDIVGNCKDLSALADESVETIYASHVLEHLGYQADLKRALREWLRVLRPGGTAMISVPDLDILCRLFVDPRVSPEDRLYVMRMMFGGQQEPSDFHHVGLNFDFLHYYLADAGFAGVRRVPSFGLFADTSASAFKGVPISLNVVAEKALA